MRLPFKRIFNPEMYQGQSRRHGYFEGWYFKIIDAKLKHVLAVIPGISRGASGDEDHAFIQALDAHNGLVAYNTYPVEAFSSDPDKFSVAIDNNRFCADGITLSMGDGALEICGTLAFQDCIRYPKSLLHPGIMGPYTFVPWMQCYHGIVNIHHEIVGSLRIGGKDVDFSGGYGYIEKDWGTSFPDAWIWLQCNHFSRSRASLMFSLAKIPWLGTSFWGFISFLLVDGRMYRFATYSHARIHELEYHGDSVRVVLADTRHKLAFTARYAPGGVLKAPKNGLMARDILESIEAVVDVALSSNDGSMVFADHGVQAGLEVVADIDGYLPGIPVSGISKFSSRMPAGEGV